MSLPAVAAYVIELPQDFRDLLVELADAGALLKNERAAGREQDLADVKALQAITGRSG